MISNMLILLLLKKCEDFVRRDIFCRKPAFEPEARIVKQFIKGVTVGLEPASRVLHGHILDSEQDDCLPLAVGQLFVDDAADAHQHVVALGRDLGSGLRVGQQSGGRRNVLILGQLVQGGIPPALAQLLTRATPASLTDKVAMNMMPGLERTQSPLKL